MTQAKRFETVRMQVKSWSETISSHTQRSALVEELRDVLTPVVLRHLPKSLQMSKTHPAIDEWITSRSAESNVMLVRDRASDRLLGLLILAECSESEFLTTVHLGYLFSEEAWGKGYATELIAGLVTWCKDEGQSVQLFGGVENGNTASSRVLQKNGFELVEDLSDATTAMFGLYIPYNFDKLYGSTPQALGEPTQLFVDFFKRHAGNHLRVLDIGCGQGRDAIFVGRLGHRVVGVDLSPNGIRDLNEAARRENLSIKGIVSDIRTFVPDGEFDVLLLDRTLHMLSEKDRLIVLKRLIGSVSGGGWVLISDEPENMQGFKEVITSSTDAWEIALDRPEALFVRQLRREYGSESEA
ncbi:GNAT family N-acetyltransferase [Phaeobacter piscinae]|uniref:GNAT family N-acetyltransferase n=1 Tax=Phaeobacter piscinae TaxID=1580596 RepID=UPI0039F677F4